MTLHYPQASIVLLLPLILGGLETGPARAAGNANARVLIHLVQNNYDFYCHSSREQPPCPDARTEGGLYPILYNAMLLIADGSPVDGIAAVTCGIDYDSGASDGLGLDIFGWALCGTIEFSHGSPAWPGPGSSNLISWDSAASCQRTEPGGPGTGVVARAGYFYCAAYAPATLRIGYSQHTGHVGKVAVAGCSGEEDIIDEAAQPHVPSPLGYVSFSVGGASPGYNPCSAVVAARPTTWSGIKALNEN